MVNEVSYCYHHKIFAHNSNDPLYQLTAQLPELLLTFYMNKVIST